MERLILLETSTALCSTALAIDGKIVDYRENDQRQHSSLTAPFIKEMIDNQGLKVSDFDAVCIGMGPGSYTGLRVGSSTAKGLCFGAGFPLLAVGSLDALVWQAIGEGLVPQGCTAIVPMIDARRMEVYTAVFSPDGERLSQTRPEIVGTDSFAQELSAGPVLFIGDGAGKCQDTITSPNAHFVQCYPKASSLLMPAQREFAARHFRDIAYFEPFYLKDFVATVSKKKLF